MSKHGKKHRNALEKINKSDLLSSAEALEEVKELAHAGFDETVDVDVNLGIDPTKGDQIVRGSVVLPHGTGRRSKVIVFAKGDYADQAKQAGADEVGAEDLVEKIQKGWLDFDYAVATPDLMGLVGKLAKLLGPRGLLPNKKVGTVTFDVANIVKDLKGGRVFFKNDKGGLVHFSIGKLSFAKKDLEDNYKAFIRALAGSKPTVSKGKFIRKITVTSTMGVGIGVSPDEVAKL